QPRPHRIATRHNLGARVLGEVVDAHDESGEPGLDVPGHGRDRLDVEDRKWCLQHGPDPDPMIGAHGDETVGDMLERIGRGDFRYEETVRLCGRNRVYILEPPWGIETVDAHDDFAPAEAARRDGIAHLGAGRVLGLRRNRILQIENDAVDWEVARPLDRTRV